MNQRDFELFKRKILEHVTVRPIEGAVRFSGNESLAHFLKKAEVLWRHSGYVGVAAYTEVKFPKTIADVLVLTDVGTKGIVTVHEILDTEKDTDASMAKKRTVYEKMGFQFETSEA